MTADPRRRRRASQFGVAALMAAVVAIVVLGVVALTTLRSSEEGVEVAAEDRPTQRFPSTPIGLVGVVSGERLTSLAAVVLDPSGVGGSIVTIPVNVDTTGGFGEERTPLARRAFTPDDSSPLTDELAPMLGIEPSFAEIVDSTRLAELLGDLDGVDVELETPIVDASDGDATEVVPEGQQRLDREQVIEALIAVPPPDSPAYEFHAGDAAVWAGVADTWSSVGAPLTLERDEAGAPEPPASLDDVMTRLRAGAVGARDLSVDPAATITLDNATDADFVLVERRDSTLVFASIAPDRVLTPNPTLTFTIVAPFNRSQLSTVGAGVTSESLIRQLIGELQFIEANVVSVDLSPGEEGAVTETIVIIDEAEFESTATVPPLIGPSSTQIAARDTEGSDVTLVLGTDFLDHRAELRARQEAERSESGGGADFDVSDGDAGSESSPTEPSQADDASGADTVESDE